MPLQREGNIGGSRLIGLGLSEVISRHAIREDARNLSDAIFLDHALAVRDHIRNHIAEKCFPRERDRLEGIEHLADIMQAAKNKDYGFRRNDVGRLADAFLLEMN